MHKKCITNGSNGQIFAVTFFAKKRKKAAIKLIPQIEALGLGRQMYKEAEQQINEGLSPFTRFLLGTLAGLMGLMMIVIAPPTEKLLYFYIFGGFCLLISFCCVTKGKVRQFAGSIIGCVLFILALGYIYSQVVGGGPMFSARSEESLFNSIMFFVFFGLPGITYVYKARFGFNSANRQKS